MFSVAYKGPHEGLWKNWRRFRAALVVLWCVKEVSGIIKSFQERFWVFKLEL